ncbi:MAG: methyltransferase [Desulfuromonadia bacterium]
MQDDRVDHNRKKHPCPDCTFCQWCSDDRCRLCRGGHSCRGRKLSLAEQVALYDEINRRSGSHTPGTSRDRIESLDLTILQPEDGYRFSVDPLLLCRFATPGDGDRVIDLGTGCGVIPLVSARLNETATFVGVERQPLLARLARENVVLNRLEGRIEIVEGDILELKGRFPVSSFDLVVANPPYRKQGSGRQSPVKGRDEARHESTATLADFLAMAKYLVSPSGRICMIHLAERLPEFLAAAEGMKMAVTRLRMVHGTIDAPARMVLFEVVKGRGAQTVVLPPLIIREEGGAYAGECSWLALR